jgi:5-methylcytosine-specific restriction endonuclease McrA
MFWGDLLPYIAVGASAFVAGMMFGGKRVSDSYSNEINYHERNAIILNGQLDAYKISSKFYEERWEDERDWRRNLIDEITSLRKSVNHSSKPDVREQFRRIEQVRNQPEYNSSNKSYKRREVPFGRRKEIYTRDGYQCLRCGSKEQLTIDHIVPVAKGGTNDFDNLQTLCRSCNCQKQTTIADYRTEELVA